MAFLEAFSCSYFLQSLLLFIFKTKWLYGL